MHFGLDCSGDGVLKLNTYDERLSVVIAVATIALDLATTSDCICLQGSSSMTFIRTVLLLRHTDFPHCQVAPRGNTRFDRMLSNRKGASLDHWRFGDEPLTEGLDILEE